MSESGHVSRWRATGYAVEQLLWLPLLVVILALFVVGGALTVVWVGVGLVIVAIPALRLIAGRQRRIAGTLLGLPDQVPYRPLPGGGPLVTLRAQLLDPMSWRDVVWLFWAVTAGWVWSLLVVVLLLVLVTSPIWWWGAVPLITLRARVDRAILTYGSTELLERRVAALTRSRAEAVDDSAAELRRIERDLHDGVQARLASLSMTLGLAESLIGSDPETARGMVVEARGASSAALADLRALVRGILPPVLADRGLDAAVRALALDLAVPTEVTGWLPLRPPPAAESAVYFAVAEALANVAKHSGARSAQVDLRQREGVLAAVVVDDGRGGAVPGAGTGLAGVARRLAALDGTMTVESPAGGPTRITLEVPCDWSSPRTTPSSATG